MKHFLSVIILALCSAHLASGQLTVKFTTVDGYVDGPLNRQPAEGEKWREQKPGAFVVDATQGTLKFDSSADSWSSAIYQKPLGSGSTYIIAIDFQVTVGNPTLKDGNAILNRFELVGEDGFTSTSLRQRGEQANFFDLWVFDGVGEKPKPSVQSAGFPGEAIGLLSMENGKAYKDNVSDNLRLLIVHKFTGEGIKFTSAAALINLKTEKEIQKVVFPNWTASDAWLKDFGKSFRINTGNMNQKSADKGATSFSITSVKIGVAVD